MYGSCIHCFRFFPEAFERIRGQLVGWEKLVKDFEVLVGHEEVGSVEWIHSSAADLVLGWYCVAEVHWDCKVGISDWKLHR